MIRDEFTRRSFLKGSAALTAVAGMGAIPRLSEGAVSSPLIDVEAKIQIELHY